MISTGDHTITVTAKPHGGSVPVVFTATCTCGFRYGPNAFKWTALGVQEHYQAAGFTNGRGLLDASLEHGEAVA